MLKPLQQWICDSCGEVIKEPKHGYFEWRTEKEPPYRNYGFRIVHHMPHSPRRKEGGDCYYSNAERGGDFDLPSFLGQTGLVQLTSMLDPGEWHVEEFERPEVVDIREWVTVFRRLHVPYFEEAHRYTDEMRDVREGGANEVAMYLPETLKRVIEEHESRE